MSGLVSCIVPIFNARSYLEAALQSVLAQTYQSLEIIVVDDGSGDDSVDFLRANFAKQITVIRQDHAGMAAARNRGFENSSGEFVSFLDADDIWPPGRLTTLVAMLEQNAQWLGCLGASQNFWDDPELQARDIEMNTGLVNSQLRRTVTAALLRSSIFDRVGVFDERYHHCSEHEWLIRAKDAGCAIGRTEEVLYLRRIHSANMSRGKKIDAEMAQIVMERIERIRSKAP